MLYGRTRGNVARITLILGLALVWGKPASAVDGVIEINEATAAAGGVTSGDLAGYPVTLSQMGSYRLTSNLMLPSADTTGIQVTSPKVTVDLNGFAIMGPVKCEGTPPQVECTPAGGGSGIFSVGNDHVTVLNGTVSGTGRAGILVNGAGTRIERVHVSNTEATAFSPASTVWPTPSRRAPTGATASKPATTAR